MIRAAVVSVACVLAGVIPTVANAHHWAPGACGLPAALPLVIEYSEVAVSPTIRNEIFIPARPPLVLATNGAPLGQELRNGGAHTIYWQMNIQRFLGTTAVPDPTASVVAAADRMYERAVATTGCATPSIALNELQGNRLPTPWSPSYAQYRNNALVLMQRLHERGAHPYMLVTTTPTPFTLSPEAVEWWRQASQVGDLVLQVHFNGRWIYAKGPVAAGRQRRNKMRSVLDQFIDIGIPSQRLGILHGFQSGRGFGGREGLPLDHWLRVVKWEVLAAKQVIAERAAEGTPVGSNWSWGWGDYPMLSKLDPQKHITACVYLWVRDPQLCDGPARASAFGVAFSTSLLEGQLNLPPGAQCAVDRRVVPSETVARFSELRSTTLGRVGRKAALAALFQRLLEMQREDVTSEEVVEAESAIIRTTFGGDPSAYAAAMAGSNADPAVARHIIADQLRREKIARTLPRRTSFRAWSLARQRNAVSRAACARDELPSVTVVDLTRWLPFLRVP